MKILCEEQTDLEPAAVSYLIQQAEQLEKRQQYQQEDVFIDVRSLGQANQALVIYHKKPVSQPSLYKDEVVGDLADLSNEPGVIRTLETGLASVGLTALSQEGLMIYQTVYPITWEGRVIGTLIIEMPPPPLPSSFPMQESSQVPWEEELPGFLEHLDNLIFVFNGEGTLIFANAKARHLYAGYLGYKDPLPGMHYDNLVLDTLTFEDLLFHNQVQGLEIEEVRVPYGGYFFQLKRQFMSNGFLLMECRDVSEIWQLQKQIEEQQMSLREINHRVKNNLQTLVSLLRLQAHQTDNVLVEQALEQSVHRILSIANIHDLLSAEKGNQMAVRPLLLRVLETVRRSFGQEFIQVVWQVDPDYELDSSRATALALIVNELLQNSFEHAFPKKQLNSQIRLHLSRKDGIIKLLITDNGSGYNVKQGFAEGHLGLILVKRFVEDKLSGRLDVQSSPRGTRTRITFHE